MSEGAVLLLVIPGVLLAIHLLNPAFASVGVSPDAIEVTFVGAGRIRIPQHDILEMRLCGPFRMMSLFLLPSLGATIIPQGVEVRTKSTRWRGRRHFTIQTPEPAFLLEMWRKYGNGS